MQYITPGTTDMTLRLSTISMKKMSTNGLAQGHFASELLHALKIVEENEPEDVMSLESEKRDSVLDIQMPRRPERSHRMSSQVGRLNSAKRCGRGFASPPRIPPRSSRRPPAATQHPAARSTRIHEASIPSPPSPPPSRPLPDLPRPSGTIV